jgi:hypothetical protein
MAIEHLPLMDRFPLAVFDYQRVVRYGTLRWARGLANWLVSGINHYIPRIICFSS